MKKFLKAVSWIIFIFAVSIAILAVMLFVAAAALLFVAYFNRSFMDFAIYATFGYFGSVTALFLIYLSVCLTQVIRRLVRKVIRKYE